MTLKGLGAALHLRDFPQPTEFLEIGYGLTQL